MAWVTKDSTETYNQTPEPQREYTKKEKAANWWHYHWMAVVVAVLVVVFGVWIIKDTVFQTRPDVQVAYVGTSDLPTDTVTALQDALTPFCSDLNGDGKVDQLDITIAQAFYQARSTDIDWNTPGANGAAPSACDVTGDSVVDIQDLIAIYLNFTA